MATVSRVAREEAPEDLSGELLGGPDLGDGWDSAGGQQREFLDGSAPITSPCPDGETVELSDEAVAQADARDASIELAQEDNGDDFVYEVLHHDPSGELFEAFRDAWESCVGQTWEQGDDPVENVRLESVELDDLGDEADRVPPAVGQRRRVLRHGPLGAGAHERGSRADGRAR